MPKKRVVASLVGNFSPVNRRRAILVKRMRQRLGETGDVLNTRAVSVHQYAIQFPWNLGPPYPPERPRFGPP